MINVTPSSNDEYMRLQEWRSESRSNEIGRDSKSTSTDAIATITTNACATSLSSSHKCNGALIYFSSVPSLSLSFIGEGRRSFSGMLEKEQTY